MPDPEVIDTHYTIEKPKRRLIWADRLAIAVFVLLTVAIFGLEILGGTYPSFSFTHGPWENYGPYVNGWSLLEIIGGATFSIWLISRLLDFVFTGRLR